MIDYSFILFFNVLILSIFSFIDYKYMRIPNKLTLFYMFIMFLSSLYLELFSLPRLLILYFAGAYLIRKNLFGGADIKIFLALSFLYPLHSLAAIFAFQKIIINCIHTLNLKHRSSKLQKRYPAIPAILFSFIVYNIVVNLI